MAQNGDGSDGTAQRALRRMAESDPELAARLILQSLPAAAAKLPEGMSYRLELDGLGALDRPVPFGGRAKVAEVLAGADLNGEAFAISTDAETLCQGRPPAGIRSVPLMSGRLKLRGRRRKAIALRRLDPDAGPRDLARLGHQVDADLVFRSLPYAIEPEWTRGHHFTVAYQLVGEGGGTWRVEVDDGTVSVERGLGESPDAIVRIRYADWLALLSGELDAARRDAAREDRGSTARSRQSPGSDAGSTGPKGIDGPELEREQRQRRLQAENAGSWGSKVTTNGASGDAGDPAETRRPRGGLMTYEQLYALWERQNWRAHELDFSVDREHWLVSPAEAQRHTAFSIGSFYVGEERVTADLAPFLLAAPSGEVGGLPRDAAGRRDAARRLLRPLGERGDGPRGRQLPRASPRDRGPDARSRGTSCSMTRCARSPIGSRTAQTTSSSSSRASSPTTWSPRVAGDARPADHDRVHRRPRSLPGVQRGGSVWSSRTSTGTSPSVSAS